MSGLDREERDLEYIHRHTFIGTASLDDFLELLDVSSDHTTSKVKVAKAFTSLAATEQLQAREQSLSGEGWEFVSRIDATSNQDDYVTNAHVKLGSICLRQFLELVPFDEKDEVAAMNVVEAFGAASHLDASVGISTGLKARGFRKWMLRQRADGA